jgi:uncharacterized protein
MSPSGKSSHGHLPAVIDPIQLAERGARLSGTLPLQGMARLAPSLLEGRGEVHVDLAFERGESDNVLLMHGRLRARLRVTCQRCLEAMDLDLEAAPWVMLLRPGARHAPGEENEPDTLVVDKPLSLSVLVEDELLLALPMVPLHEPGRCVAGARVTDDGGAGESQADGKSRPSPFSMLQKMKTTK